MKLRSIALITGLGLGLMGCTKTDLGTPSTPTCNKEEVICNEAANIFVDGTNGNDTADGSSKYPVKSISHALDLAKTGTKKSIIISTGDYPENIDLVNGISLRGQYDSQNEWKRSTTSTTTIRNVSGKEYSGVTTSFGLQGENLTSPTTLSRISVIAKDAFDSKGNGASSIGFHCVNCGGLVMEDMNISAGAAGAGIEWVPNSAGAIGTDGENGVSSTCQLAVGPNGGLGANGPNGNSGGKGGRGGNSTAPTQGENGASGLPYGSGGGKAGVDKGENGENGNNGSDGADGTNATNGQDGNGGSGGGGAAGASFFTRNYEGNSAGGGGAGGAGGQSGRGGKGGGSSIALFLINSTGAKLVGTNFFTSANAADGRSGEAGGKGGTGGKGGKGGSTSICRTITVMGIAGDGGHGGNGGHAGSGGSGAGGSSVGILLANTVLNDGADIKNLVQISTGLPGKGGAPAASAISLPTEAGKNGEAKDILIISQ